MGTGNNGIVWLINLMATTDNVFHGVNIKESKVGIFIDILVLITTQ